MTDTQTLIARLSSEAATPVAARSPVYWAVRLLVVLVLYGIAAQVVLGLRSDLMLQFTRPLFAVEVGLLVAIVLTSSLAAILAMYPDASGKSWFLRLPYLLTALFVGLIAIQLFLPPDAMMHLPTTEASGLPCTICIALLAALPSALLLMIQRQGASVRPFQAGALAVLAASAAGCLALRLHEPNDDLMHLITAHYVPTLLFAVIGARLGKWLLKW